MRDFQIRPHICVGNGEFADRLDAITGAPLGGGAGGTDSLSELDLGEEGLDSVLRVRTGRANGSLEKGLILWEIGRREGDSDFFLSGLDVEGGIDDIRGGVGHVVVLTTGSSGRGMEL